MLTDFIQNILMEADGSDKVSLLKSFIHRFIDEFECQVFQEDHDGISFTYPLNPDVARIYVAYTPANGSVPFWFENTDGIRGSGWKSVHWHPDRGPSPDSDSNHFRLSAISEDSYESIRYALTSDAEWVVSDAHRIKITDIVPIKDLDDKFAPRGWSTSANSTRYNHYEVVGQNLIGDKIEEVAIVSWLTASGKTDLMPGIRTRAGGMVRIENTLSWDGDHWIITSVSSVYGD